VSPIQTFSAEAYNTTNGVSGKYFITWYTDIETDDGDNLYVNFPDEIEFVSPYKNDKLRCSAVIDSLTRVSCKF
jgi:hypothetical protein